jgi:putative ABC transport system ATP-binding protein
LEEKKLKTILEARNLYKIFEDNQVLKGINIKIDKGEFIAIMGPSGSGKSTLLYNISGMDRATSGDIIFDGEQLIDMSDDKLSMIRLRKMGFIFQHSYLLKNLSIHDNIVLPGFKAGLKSRNQINKEACELMDKTGIICVSTHDISKVSGGQLQRAAVCRALIQPYCLEMNQLEP